MQVKKEKNMLTSAPFSSLGPIEYCYDFVSAGNEGSNRNSTHDHPDNPPSSGKNSNIQDMVSSYLDKQSVSSREHTDTQPVDTHEKQSSFAMF